MYSRRNRTGHGLQIRILDWKDQLNNPGKKYNIRMIVDDTIATIYVDGVALNARALEETGRKLIPVCF